MAIHEMDANDSPLLFRFPTAQVKPFRSPSASTSSRAAMNGADLGGALAVHQSSQPYETTHPMLGPGDMGFDAVLDPSMLHTGYLPATFGASSHLPQHQVFLPTHDNLSMIFDSQQLQNHQLNCPRSVPIINSANNVATPEDSHHSPEYYLAPDTLQSQIDFSIHQTTYPIDELESNQIHRGESINPVEMYPAAEQDGFCDDQIDRESVFRYSATPFGGSDVGSPVDDCHLDRDEPYAQRIFRCLKEAPNHTMVLKDIYKWFNDNTEKGQDPNYKGWQNSIRHNLSMNKAFNKIELPPEKDQKRRYVWQLSEQALREGVQSTTRFRNKQPNKRATKSHGPSPSRVASGQKGGEAARKAAYLRRSERLNEARLQTIRNGLQSQIDYPHTSVPASTSSSSPAIGSTDGEGRFSASAPQPFNGEIERALRALGHQFGGPGNIQSRTFSDSSYPNSPDFSDHQTEVHFLPLADGPLFSDSPESSSEPHTPSTYPGEMAVDHQPFIGVPSDGMMF